MDKHFFIFLFLFLPFIGHSQTGFKIKGYVKDSETDLPIEKVSIVLKNSKKIAITDKFGYFEIQAAKFPAELLFTHICYDDYKISVKDSSIRLFEIKLNYKINLLKTIDIKGLNIETVSKNAQFWAMDYEFLDNNILLLNLKNNISNGYLYLMNSSGDTLTSLDLKKHNVKPVKFFRDCLDNIHIVTQDSAYQVFYSHENGLELKFPAEINKFYYNLNTCLTSIDTCVYFSYLSYHGFISQFYFVNMKNKVDQTTYRTIIDSNTINRFENFYNRVYYEEILRAIPHNYIWKVSDEQLKYNRYHENGEGLLGVFYPALYTPLLNINDTLYIFNHYQSQIERYTKMGKIINKIPIDYYKENYWIQSIILDKKTLEVYTLFFDNGIYTIKEIDLKSGAIKRSVKIPELLFIEKIKVNNNYIYFLYRDRYKETGENKMLYRMKI